MCKEAEIKNMIGQTSYVKDEEKFIEELRNEGFDA